MGRHIVFAVEFLVTNGARVRFSVQVSGNVMSMEIGRMSVRIVADLTTIRIPFLQAIRTDTNGRIGVTGSRRPGRAGRIARVRPDRALGRASKEGVIGLELEGG